MKIVETDAQIQADIEKLLYEHVAEVLADSAKIIESQIRTIVIQSIQSEPEYQSLISGRLRGELGLTDAQGKVAAVIDTFSRDIYVTVNKTQILIEMIKGDMSNILSISEAEQMTEKGKSLDWLDWLLRKGDTTIIREYEIKETSSSQSRTGLAIMTKAKGKKWGIPSEFAGIETNNWITRAIDNIGEDTIQKLIMDEIYTKW